MNQTDPSSLNAWDEHTSQTFIDYGRYFVPDREYQFEVVASLIPRLDRKSLVIDLCCGEGLLAELILKRLPEVTLLGLDGSPEMLERAVERLAPFGNRFSAERIDLFSRTWRHTEPVVDAVVSSLAVHHLDGEQKQILFGDISAMLNPGGVLVIADVVEPAHPLGWKSAAEGYDQTVRQRALELDGNLDGFNFFERQRWNMFRYFDPADIDKPSGLFDQLKWLEAAGFEKIDVHWMKAGQAIFSGWKPTR